MIALLVNVAIFVVLFGLGVWIFGVHPTFGETLLVALASSTALSVSEGFR
jgi:hypothetical protein